MSSIEQSIAEMKQSIVALEQRLSAVESSPVKPKGKQGKKGKKAEAAEESSEATSEEQKPAKAPSAWNVLVTQTVSEMKQSGWESWTDLKGTVWPASRKATVKDKKGVESEQFVYDGGDHDGKQPSPALGGMVRASYLKGLTDPEAKAKAEAYHAKLAEKRSTSGSVTSGAAEAEPVADGEAPAKKKGGRPKMTDEQKAAAKAKKEAKKAAEAAAATTEEVEMAAEEVEDAEADGAQTPVAAPVPEPVKKAPLVKIAPKAVAKPAAKKLDLSLFSWTFKGTEYLTNDRKDIVDATTGEWIGRFDGTKIDESVAEPADLAAAGMRDAE
jgi:hypothetical protein